MKIKINIIVDFLMTILLLFLVSYQIVSEKMHEWLGMTMGILVILHIFLNRWWYKNLFKGKYSLMRIIQTIINFLILLTILGSLISGITMSRYIFPALVPYNNYMALSRALHILSAYWGFVLMSIHLGLHWSMLFSILNQKLLKIKKKYLFFYIILAWGIASYGAYAFYKLNLFSFMFLQSQFIFFDYEKNLFLVFFDYFSIMILWILLSFYTIKLLKRNIFTKK
ncbi:DUF4405 domain-containing protein [Fusobacterium simiae]|uniref:DUF4405 domain-containing protein n=1 Tax=Fusobacterium simiae TaxID=855 RepID=A0ABT4DKB1_FUSSI|nr:DUF4405 domain-containing protein [Fusobacterium simiae]MCY7009043.1 DUF4405 domain-containing protein [Fusobacterium simiae]